MHIIPSALALCGHEVLRTLQLSVPCLSLVWSWLLAEPWEDVPALGVLLLVPVASWPQRPLPRCEEWPF